MKILRFEGYSDDTFGEILHFKDDYDNCASGKPIDWIIKSNEGSMMVRGQYCPQFLTGNPGMNSDGASGWLIGVARVDDDDEKPMPNWDITIINGDRTYSPALIITVPDDAMLICLNRDGNK